MRSLGFVAGIVLLFLLSPLVWVVSKGAHIDAIRSLADRADVLSALGQSLSLAVASAAVSTFFGTLTAFALPSLGPWSKKFVRTGLVFPMVLPEIAVALSFLVWFVKLGIPRGWGTLISSHVAFSLSYATLVMKSRVETLDKSLVDAARDLGASRFETFRHGILPQLVPGLAASFVTCFSLSLDDYLISSFVKGLDQMTLPIQIYSMIRVRLGDEIYALSLLLFCISVAVVLLSQLWLTSKNKSVSSRIAH